MHTNIFFSGTQLQDVDFKVSKNNNEMVDFCGQFTVHASTGQQVAIFCPYNTTEQYVQLQIMAANSNVLTPAEVLV